MFKISKSMIDSVAFLGVKSSEGEIVPKATAFYVIVPYRKDVVKGRGYLVTAKHNIVKANGRPLYVSINPSFRGNQAKWIPLPKELIWNDHREDSSVDVVIADWRPDSKYSSSYRGILLQSFLDFQPELLNRIGMGNEVKVAGLFPFHSGRHEHRTILRSGIISMFPEDKVNGGDGSMDAYLIETKSLGGLSGSPVFAVDIGKFPKVSYPFLGLIHGHWDYKNEKVDGERIQVRNSGMSIVTPGRKIIDILYLDELVEGRTDFDCMSREELQKNTFSTRVR